MLLRAYDQRCFSSALAAASSRSVLGLAALEPDNVFLADTRQIGCRVRRTRVRVAEPAKQPFLVDSLTAKVLYYAERLAESEHNAKEDIKKLAEAERVASQKLLEAERAANKKLAEAVDRSTSSELQAVDRKYRLRRCQGELMRLHGMLSMRGVFDYIYTEWDDEEELMRQTRNFRRDRIKQWCVHLKKRPELLECIQQHAKTRFGDTTDAAEYVVEMYQDLCDRIHNNRRPDEYSNARDEIRIVDGALDRRQCRALKCICDDFEFPASIVFKPDPIYSDDSDVESDSD